MVYFILDRDRRAVKIGVADDPRKRLAGLQTAHAVVLELLAVIPGGTEVERKLHEQFGKLRIRGEWFRATKDLRSYIDSLDGRVTVALPSSTTRRRIIDLNDFGRLINASEIVLSHSPDVRQDEISLVERRLRDSGITPQTHPRVYAAWDRVKDEYPQPKAASRRKKRLGGYRRFSRKQHTNQAVVRLDRQIAEGCRLAGVPTFTMTDVRYTAACDVRKAFGLDELDEDRARRANAVCAAAGW